MIYEIKGGNFPAVICKLSSGEQMISEGGGMGWMSPNMKMETSGGGIGKMFGRLISGEKLFQNIYTAEGDGEIAFTSSFPGDIKALEVAPGREYIIQKSSFLASSAGVELSVYLQKKFGSGFFGGEGFIMQHVSGNGTVFLEIDGAAVEYDLEAGQQIVASTGHVVMMSSTCKMDIRAVKGVKNFFFGGEGLFNTVVEGPGKVILQTMPVNKLAATLIPYLPKNNNNSGNND